MVEKDRKVVLVITQDFLGEVVMMISENLELPVPIMYEQLSSDDRSIAIQSSPSSAIHHYKGSRTSKLQFNILTKSDSRYEANGWLDSITNLLNQDYFEVIQEPNYLGKENNCFIYVATFQKTIRRY